MQLVKIVNGTHKIRGEDVSMTGRVFPLVTGFKVGTRGGYITVDARKSPGLPDRNIKLKCHGEHDYVPVTDTDEIEVFATEQAADPLANVTDAEIIERMRVRFGMLTDMTKAVKKGDVTAMIVSGPPGVGKSHGIEEVLSRYDTVSSLGGPVKYEVVKGAMSAIGLYCKLYKYAARDNVLVFDDCDSIFNDELSLNILKAALDSKKRRTIHWNTDSFKLRNEGVPNSFDFEGSAIFVTNLKFDKSKGKIRDHLQALESRCHYIDLTIDTDREKMLRIRQVIEDGMLNQYTLDDDVKSEIIDYVDDNVSNLREVSLRTVLKIADLAVAFPFTWQDMAQNTVMRRD
jgi:hypothetical protein